MSVRESSPHLPVRGDEPTLASLSRANDSETNTAGQPTEYTEAIDALTTSINEYFERYRLGGKSRTPFAPERNEGTYDHSQVGLALGGEPTAGEMDGRSNNEQSASIVGSREETYTCDEGDAMLHEERLDRWIEPQKCINQKPNASVF